MAKNTNNHHDWTLVIHGFTASGALAGMAALVAVLDGKAEVAILWLLVAQLIDGVDGPIARRVINEDFSTTFDGYVLDLVVDFFTCVVVPGVFLWRFAMIPHGFSGNLTLSMLLVFSALWFSKRQQQDNDGWFIGFPAAWNVVVPTLWILGAGQTANTVCVLVLSLATMTSVRFAHTTQSKLWRPWNITGVAVWSLGLLIGSFDSARIEASLLCFLGAIMTIGASFSHSVAVAHDEKAAASLL